MIVVEFELALSGKNCSEICDSDVEGIVGNECVVEVVCVDIVINNLIGFFVCFRYRIILSIKIVSTVENVI